MDRERLSAQSRNGNFGKISEDTRRHFVGASYAYNDNTNRMFCRRAEGPYVEEVCVPQSARYVHGTPSPRGSIVAILEEDGVLALDL